jgi:hypothetical protein
MPRGDAFVVEFVQELFGFCSPQIVQVTLAAKLDPLAG